MTPPPYRTRIPASSTAITSRTALKSRRRTRCYPNSSRRSAPSTSAACFVRRRCSTSAPKFARGEIDQRGADRRRGRGDQGGAGAAGARRAEVRDRRRIPPPLLSQLLLPPARRSQHRHRRRRGRQGRHRDRRHRQARQPAGRADQEPRALDHPINVPDFKFIRANTRLIPKITIPGPCALHFRGGDAAVLASAYTDLDQFWDDTVEAFGQRAEGARRRRLPLRADRRDRLRQVRRSRGAGRA